MLKRILQILGLAFIVLIVVLVTRAATFTPRHIQVPAATAFTPPPGAIERLAGAVRIPTISPSDSTQRDSTAFRLMHTFLEQSFPRVHAAMAHENVGKDALLYEWKGTDASLSPVVLMGHMDVVPVDPASLSLWKHPPFAGDTADGFVWGRGTFDDKATVMGLLDAAEALIGQGFTPRRTIYFSFGADEEVGGAKGARVIASLLKSRGVKPYLVLDEGGTVVDHAMAGVQPPVAVVGIAEKGYVTLELTVHGVGGHSSNPPRHTAAGILARAVTRVDPRVEVTKTGETFEPSLPSPTNDSAWAGLEKTIRQIYPEAVIGPYLVLGATDSRYFRALTPNVYRFTGARIDITDRDRIHGTNERISEKSYLDGIRFSEQLIRNLSGG